MRPEMNERTEESKVDAKFTRRLFRDRFPGDHSCVRDRAADTLRHSLAVYSTSVATRQPPLSAQAGTR
jgi:hypothetical protein